MVKFSTNYSCIIVARILLLFILNSNLLIFLNYKKTKTQPLVNGICGVTISNGNVLDILSVTCGRLISQDQVLLIVNINTKFGIEILTI